MVSNTILKRANRIWLPIAMTILTLLIFPVFITFAGSNDAVLQNQIQEVVQELGSIKTTLHSMNKTSCETLPKPNTQTLPQRRTLAYRPINPEARRTTDPCGLKSKGLLIDPAEFIEKYTQRGKLYHATATSQIKSIFDHGFFISGHGFGGDSFGPGLYTGKDQDHLRKVFGLPIPLTLEHPSALRVLKCHSDPTSASTPNSDCQCSNVVKELGGESFLKDYHYDNPGKCNIDWSKFSATCDIDIVFDVLPTLKGDRDSLKRLSSLLAIHARIGECFLLR